MRRGIFGIARLRAGSNRPSAASRRLSSSNSPAQHAFARFLDVVDDELVFAARLVEARARADENLLAVRELEARGRAPRGGTSRSAPAPRRPSATSRGARRRGARGSRFRLRPRRCRGRSRRGAAPRDSNSRPRESVAPRTAVGANRRLHAGIIRRLASRFARGGAEPVNCAAQIPRELRYADHSRGAHLR